MRLFYLFALLFQCLNAEIIETFYGKVDVEEPVLLELIHSPALERLKEIHQYGVAYYTTHFEEYNRFDHSVGVFAILRAKGASIEEQIAGLLHDASHTVFSHVGDWVFGKEHQEEDYQSTIHRLYLAFSGIEEILNRHGFTIEQVLPKRAEFKMLEQSLPNLSADRIDYNIQGAYFQGFLTLEEAKELFQDLVYENEKWTLSNQELAKKLTLFSFFMTEDCWGSAQNHMNSLWLADAILQGLSTGLITWKEFHFGVDDEVWNKLKNANDPLIQNRMQRLFHSNKHFECVEPEKATKVIKFRCRGIDPLIRREGTAAFLTSMDAEIANKFQKLKEQASRGWSIRDETNF
jgi:HD superfamily phosphohydrolase